MRINIKIDADFEEPEALITTACMTDEVNRVIDFINRSEEAATVISGFKDDKVTLLEQEELVRPASQDHVTLSKHILQAEAKLFRGLLQAVLALPIGFFLGQYEQ